MPVRGPTASLAASAQHCRPNGPRSSVVERRAAAGVVMSIAVIIVDMCNLEPSRATSSTKRRLVGYGRDRVAHNCYSST